MVFCSDEIPEHGAGLGGGVFVAFVFLVVILLPVRVYDRELFLALNGLHWPWTDQVWLALTTAGDGFLLAIVLGAFVVVNPRVAVLGLGLMLTSSVAVQVIKAVLPTLRPASLLDGVHVLGPLLRSGSFPSGHSASAISAALGIAHYTASPLGKWAVLTLGVMIALSRVLVGAHFPSDVIGGLAIGTGLFCLARRWNLFPNGVSSTPSRGFVRFRVAVTLELTAALIGLLWYSLRHAESAIVSIGISSAVLCFVLGMLFKKREDRP